MEEIEAQTQVVQNEHIHHKSYYLIQNIFIVKVRVIKGGFIAAFGYNSNQGPMEKGDKVPGVEPVPQGTDHKSDVIGNVLSTAFFLLFLLGVHSEVHVLFQPVLGLPKKVTVQFQCCIFSLIPYFSSPSISQLTTLSNFPV